MLFETRQSVTPIPPGVAAIVSDTLLSKQHVRPQNDNLFLYFMLRKIETAPLKQSPGN